MKKTLLFLMCVLLLAGLSQAQTIAGFNTPGSLDGYSKASDSGVGIDSMYQTAGPTNSGVLAVHFTFNDFATQHGRIVYQPTGGMPVSGAQFITWWIYLPSSANITDSTQISVYAMNNNHWQWTEDKVLAMSIPKDKWYPLSFPLVQHYKKNPNFDIKNDQIAQSGLQVIPAQANWTGTIYIDSVALVGAKPSTIENFSSTLGLFSNQWHNGWVDSCGWVNGPIGDSLGVAAVVLKNGSAATGGTAYGIQPAGAGIAAQDQNILAMWVYVDSTFPDTAHIQTWAQSDPSWNWPASGTQDYIGSAIPRNVWYPIYFDLNQASIIDTVSGSYFNTMKANQNLRKFGIQVYGTQWTGTIYVDNLELLNSKVAVIVPPKVWTAADFATGAQSFYVPSYASGTVQRYLDLTTSRPGYVLQGSMTIAPATPKFAVVRDSVPLMDPDSIATNLSIMLYMPSKVPKNGLVKFYVRTGPGDSVAVVDTIGGTKVKTIIWNTLVLPKLDSLAQIGKIDPTKPARVGIEIYYPAPYDTTQVTANIELDNLTVYGIHLEQALGVANNGMITEYKLYGNYPNPFNPSTKIRFDVPKQSKVQIVVYDVLGRRVATLLNEQKSMGSYELTFDASRFTSGVYFYRMTAGDYVKTQKMVLMK